MTPLVSIVIPTYNTAEYIPFTLDSLAAQSFKNFETLVVDDGSTDATRDALEPYQSWIVYIHQENSGRSEARNTGIKAAKGKYVAFLDSDDLWTEHKLARQVELMEIRPDMDFLFGDKQRFSSDGSVIMHSMFRKKGYDRNFFGDPLFVSNPYRKLLDEPYIPTGTVMMRRACFKKTGLFDPNIYAEDWEFWLRVALRCKIAYVEEIWELERDRPGSGSKNLHAVYESNIQSLEKHKRMYAGRLQKMGIDLDGKLRVLYKHYGYFLLESRKELARNHLRKSLSFGFDFKTLAYWASSYLPSGVLRFLRQTREAS